MRIKFVLYYELYSSNYCYAYNVMMRRIAIFFLLSLPATVAANDIYAHESGIWSLAPTETTKRWVVIHNLQEGKVSGIYHIEVIGRNNGDATWQIKHLVPHMAITEDALRKSVVEPLNRGSVYPETYQNAYSKWLNENNGQGGRISRTSVVECM